MKLFFQELFEYNHHCNQKLIEVVNENQMIVSGQTIRLLNHTLNVHQVWNFKCYPGQLSYGPWQIHPIQNLHTIDRINFEQSMQVLDQFNLNDVIHYTTSKGQPFDNTVCDILFHVINHSTYHRAQIATEFRQSGMEPVITDYIYYKMRYTP